MASIIRVLHYLKSDRLKIVDYVVRKLGGMLPDKIYLSLRYRCLMGNWVDWKNPQLYQEKLQWLKLYNRKDIYTKMVDKIAVKEYVASIIGEQYIIPTLGVWDTFDSIDFDTLPNKFVLKTNNGGGNTGVVVCNDKTILDKVAAKRILERSMRSSIYKNLREWPYKNVKPKILAEQYMDDDSDLNKGGLTDYKFTCFNGVAENVMACIDRQIKETKFYFLDRQWKVLPLNVRGKMAGPDVKIPKPPCIEEMFEIASKLSAGIPFLRVDLYCIGGRPYFGETTFFPASGFDPNILPETEILFGNKIKLTNIKTL